MKNIFKIKDDEIDDIELGALILIIKRSYSLHLDHILKKYNITGTQSLFIKTLSKKNNVSQEYFAELFHLNEGTVTRTLQKLEEKNLIKREEDPLNKRKKIVSLTKKGKELSSTLKNVNQELEQKLYGELKIEEQRKLKIQLKNIAINAIESDIKEQTN
jgi:DNA-binding MarR family transcriptional regulator